MDELDFRRLAEQRRVDVAAMKGQIKNLRATVADLKTSQDDLAGKITPLLADLEKLIELFQAAAGAFKVFEFIGRLAKPTIAIGAVIGSIYTAWTKFRS